jgi:hypothetical protein
MTCSTTKCVGCTNDPVEPAVFPVRLNRYSALKKPEQSPEANPDETGQEAFRQDYPYKIIPTNSR